MKKHILFYPHYYPPDVASIGQIIKELADGICDTFDVTVICAVASYSGNVDVTYNNAKYYKENINGVNVIRVHVPKYDKTNKISRVKNIIIYFLRAMYATLKTTNIDCVFCVSQPPILGGLLGVWGKWTKSAKLIYNIQDYNPEQVIATSYSKNRFVISLMMMLDKFSCKCSDKVIIVGRDMIETLENRFKNKKVPAFTFINNWIDEKEIYPLETDNSNVVLFKEKYNLIDKFVIMYSGNIGLYYDLENIIKVIEKYPASIKASDGREVVFAFVGDGNMRCVLEDYAEKHKMKNIAFIPYQDKSELNYSLNAADVHWCVSAKGIKGVSCPSKFYGIIAAGKPVLGVMENGSECRIILEETQCGLVCEPRDYDSIDRLVGWFINNADNSELIEMGKSGRCYLESNLSKNVSVGKYINEISSLICL